MTYLHRILFCIFVCVSSHLSAATFEEAMMVATQLDNNANLETDIAFIFQIGKEGNLSFDQMRQITIRAASRIIDVPNMAEALFEISKSPKHPRSPFGVMLLFSSLMQTSIHPKNLLTDKARSAIVNTAYHFLNSKDLAEQVGGAGLVLTIKDVWVDVHGIKVGGMDKAYPYALSRRLTAGMRENVPDTVIDAASLMLMSKTITPLLLEYCKAIGESQHWGSIHPALRKQFVGAAYEFSFGTINTLNNYLQERGMKPGIQMPFTTSELAFIGDFMEQMGVTLRSVAGQEQDIELRSIMTKVSESMGEHCSLVRLLLPN